MNHYGVYLILTLTATVFIVVSYFVKKEIIRSLIFIPSALIAIFCIGTVIGIVAGKTYCKIERFNYNAWYSGSTEYLIDTIIVKLEAGEQEQVIQELKALDSKFSWTYEVRGNYDELVSETIEKLNSDPKNNSEINERTTP